MDPQQLNALLDTLGEHGATLRQIMQNQANQISERSEEAATLREQLQAAQEAQATQQNAASAPPLNPAFAATLAEAFASLPAPVINLPSTPRTRKAKGADPEIFSGDVAKTEEFLRSVSLNIALQPMMYASDHSKILYALSWIKGGTAGVWAENVTAAILNPPAGTELPTWEQFLAVLRSAFGEPDLRFASRLKLHNLKQDRLTAEEYTAQFKALAARCGFDKEALMDAYQRGLNHALLAKIHLSELPVTLNGWKAKTKALDNLYRRYIQATGGPKEQGNRNCVVTPSFSHTSESSSGPVPMDIGAATTIPPSGGTRNKTRTCYNCDKVGHLSRNCPDPQRKKRETVKAITTEDIAAIIRSEIGKLLPTTTTPAPSTPGF